MNAKKIDGKFDRLSNFFSTVLHRLPSFKLGGSIIKLSKLGNVYDNHFRFFNDGLVELTCLIVANAFIWLFSYLKFIELSLILLNLLIATPITFTIKYFAHKLWVWRTK